MIVVTTPTGHIGSQLVAQLLAASEPVRVIARDPARLSAEVRAKVEIVRGSSDDEGVLLSALEGAESCSWSCRLRLQRMMCASIIFSSPVPRAAPSLAAA